MIYCYNIFMKSINLHSIQLKELMKLMIEWTHSSLCLQFHFTLFISRINAAWMKWKWNWNGMAPALQSRHISSINSFVSLNECKLTEIDRSFPSVGMNSFHFHFTRFGCAKWNDVVKLNDCLPAPSLPASGALFSCIGCSSFSSFMFRTLFTCLRFVHCSLHVHSFTFRQLIHSFHWMNVNWLKLIAHSLSPCHSFITFIAFNAANES